MKINVVGMGVMGCQIASLLYLLGYDVAVTTRSGVNEKKMHRSNKILRKFLDVDSNKLGSVRFCKDISDLYDACTIESVAEDLLLKKEIYSCIRKFTNKPTVGIGGLNVYNIKKIAFLKLDFLAFCSSVWYNKNSPLEEVKKIKKIIDYSL